MQSQKVILKKPVFVKLLANGVFSDDDAIAVVVPSNKKVFKVFNGIFLDHLFHHSPSVGLNGQYNLRFSPLISL